MLKIHKNYSKEIQRISLLFHLLVFSNDLNPCLFFIFPLKSESIVKTQIFVLRMSETLHCHF